MTKPTAAQIEVLNLMQNGWELATGLGFESSAWLQYGGAGKGGESKRVRQRTVQAMELSGLIETSLLTYPTKTFKVSRYGMRVLKGIQ